MATALETASLVMVPSGYEDGTLGSLQPLDGTGDFTFTRGSNISATRVNEDGYIERGYENLLLQSNTFNTTWQQASLNTPISGQPGYDGASDAWLIESQVAFGQLYQDVSTSGVVSYSVYAKAGTCTSVNLQINATFSVTGFFFLTGEGTSSASSTQVISTSIQRIGTSDWYRCAITYNNSAITRIRILPSDESGSPIAGTLYIQDAQLNQGLVAYPYLETTTTTAKGGILENMPRLDYSGGRCSLLLEPSRTNLSTNSEYTSVSNGAITYNDAISPEGIQNAIKITATSAAFPRFYNTTTFGGGNTYIVSFYVKKGVGDGVGLYGYSNVNYNNVVRFNLDTNEVTYLQTAFSNGYIEDAGNGWKRCVATLTTPSTGSWSGINAVINKANFLQAEVGDEHYFYGMQVEQDATYPTSYIPTYGVSQTRLKDNFDSSADFTNFFGNNQGTIYIETNKRLFENLPSNEEFIGFKDQTKYWRIIGSQTIIFIQCSNWGSTIINYPSNTTPTKYLFKWDGSNVSFYIDGTLIGTAAQTATFNPNQFGRSGNGVDMESQELLNQFTLFPTALSDEACIELTTI